MRQRQLNAVVTRTLVGATQLYLSIRRPKIEQLDTPELFEGQAAILSMPSPVQIELRPT